MCFCVVEVKLFMGYTKIMFVIFWHCMEMSKILPNGTVNMGLCVFFGMCDVLPNVEIKKY